MSRLLISVSGKLPRKEKEKDIGIHLTPSMYKLNRKSSKSVQEQKNYFKMQVNQRISVTSNPQNVFCGSGCEWR